MRSVVLLSSDRTQANFLDGPKKSCANGPGVCHPPDGVILLSPRMLLAIVDGGWALQNWPTAIASIHRPRECLTPVIQRASSGARNTIKSATSLGSPIRLRECMLRVRLRPTSVLVKVRRMDLNHARCNGVHADAGAPQHHLIRGNCSHYSLNRCVAWVIDPPARIAAATIAASVNIASFAPA